MKKYELVLLNKGISWGREKDLEKTQDAINAKTSEGWELLQIVSPSDCAGALYGLFVKET